MAEETTTYILKGKTEDLQRKLKASSKDLKNVKSEGDNTTKSLGNLGKGAQVTATKIAALAAAAVLSSKAIHDMLQETADLRNELTDTAAKSGVAAETLAGLRLAAKGSGQEFKSLTRGLQGLPKRFLDASRGTGEAAQAFKDLDIDVNDANDQLRSTDDILKETIKKLQGLENQEIAAGLGAKILGDRLGPGLRQALGNTGIEEFIQQARAGTDVSNEAADAAARWQRESALLATAIEGAKDSVFDSLSSMGLSWKNFGKLAIATTTIVNSTSADMAFRISSLAVAAKELASGDIRGAAQAIAEGHKQAMAASAQAAKDATAAMDNLDAAIEKTVKGSTRAGEAARDEAAARREAAKAAALYRKQLDVINQIQIAGAHASDDLLSAQDAIREEYGRQIGALEDLADKAHLTAAQRGDLEVAIAELIKRMNREIANDQEATDRARIESTLKAFAEKQAAERKSAEESKRLAAEQARAYVDAAGTMASAFSNAFATIEAREMQHLSEVQDNIDEARTLRDSAGEERTRQIEDIERRLEQSTGEERKELRKQLQNVRAVGQAEKDYRDKVFQIDKNRLKRERKQIRESLMATFVAEKAAALSEIVINTARGVMMANTIPPPAGQALAAAVLTAGTVQTAVVASEKPSFHIGTERVMGTGEVPSVLRPEEAVLTPGAADSFGRDNIRRANAGQSTGGGVGTLQLVWKARILDTMMADVIRSGGEAATAMGEMMRASPPSVAGDMYGGR